jgi:hypothetical protein
MSKHSPQKNARAHAVEPQKLLKPQPNVWPPIAALAILAYGLYRAIDLRWICDDAFITMRYVKNFVDGNGLVYNIGERVEGYTHFLWLMLLAASKAVGFDSVDASMWLGIAAYAGIIILLLLISFREHKKNPKALWLPIAAALFAFNYDTQVWASGGLETSLYTLLILSAFYLWFYSKFSEQRRLLLTGLALALISLTRPDGVLFTATAIALLAAREIRKGKSVPSALRSVGILLLPSIIIGVPYLIWKYSYYGDILPLTYYAKSADENYFVQGFFYIWLYFRVHFISAIALIAAVPLFFVYRNTNGEPLEQDENAGSPFIAALAGIAVYLILFVARVGGDFMFARFIIPVVPLVYLVMERALEWLPVKVPNYRIGIAVLLVASVFAENKYRDDVLFHPNKGKWDTGNWELTGDGSTRGIADERWTYYFDRFFLVDGAPRPSMDVYTEVGKYLEPFFGGLSYTVAVPGGANMRAYYANFTTCINEFGLTDSSVAHSSILNRARIGHEKKATEAYLAQRHVDFELEGVIAKLPTPLPQSTIAFYIPTLGFWQLARVITYDRAKMEELSKRFKVESTQSIFPIYEEIISYYIQRVMPTRTLAQVEQEYAGYRQLYFNQHPNPPIQHLFETRIAELKRNTSSVSPSSQPPVRSHQ